MKKFKPSILTLSLMAAGLSIASAPVFAQDAQPKAAQVKTEAKVTEQKTPAKEEKSKANKEEQQIEVIQVTGFLGSVIKSLNTKRFADTVVDAISADDIGGLPDVSIADSLTRLPGVTSVRTEGQSTELNIRGLSGGFVFATLNGRELVSSSGGRTVQFDQYPSELIKQAQVYKSQKASLIEGGVAGTIELETANALDNDENRLVRFSVQGNYNNIAADNNDSDSIGQRLTASYQEKFLDETLGVSLGYARMFQPTVSSRFVNYQFDPKNLANSYDGAPEDILVSSGFELNERGGTDKRDAFVIGLNWEPRDDLRIKSDVFYSKFDSERWDRGLRVSGLNNIASKNSSLVLTNPIVSNGALIGGTFSRDPNGNVMAPPFKNSERSMNVQTQADDNTKNSKVLSIGLNGEWDINDQMTLSIDFSHSEASETYKDQVLRLAYFEDSSAETPVIDDNIVMDYQLNGLGIPSVSFNQDYTDLSKMMVTSAESYPRIEDNSADAVKVDFIYELDNDYVSSIEAGVRVSQRKYELDRGRFLYGTTDFNMRNGQYITYDGTDENGNPIEVERFAPFQLTPDMASTASIGGDLSGMPSFLSINNSQILDAWIPNVDRTPIKRWDQDWTMSQNNIVEEDVTAAYLQVNLDTEVFGLPMTGNIGLRVVQTEQKSTGLLNAGKGNGEEIADDRGVISDSWILGTEGTKYTDYLPSFNFNFSLTDSDQLRFAYAKVMARADMGDLANSGNFQWNQRADGNFVDLNSSTSPKVRPFYADQIDISYEHYFTETDGAFVFALWNKDISNYPDTLSEQYFDYAAAGITLPPVPEQYQTDEVTGDPLVWENTGTYNRLVNIADAGYIRGVEVAYTQTFKFLPGLWSGLGANVNFSYTQSEIERPSTVPGEEGQLAPIPGLSPRVYSATIFYDWEEKFTARLSARHRGAYLGEQIAIGSSQSAYFEAETIVLAQASYNFTDKLQGVISVDNLTDEPNISYFGDTTRTGTIQYFGRTIYFGFNYKL
jgi:iron complex outermembrane recepter protein